jgi:4-hydroxy-2-oxoglutarate aldolase
MLLEGMYIPLATPFHPDGGLNPAKLAANVARYSKTPAAGLIVLGRSGEPTLLADDETREVLSAAAKAAAAEKVLIAGVSRDSVRATLALADFAAGLDYDAILVGVPSVLAASAQASSAAPRLRELLTYFQTIADRSTLPIVLLSDASRALPLAATVELATHPNILGLLETEARAAQPSEIAEVLRRTAAIQRKVTVTPVFAAVTARITKAAATNWAQPTFISADTLAETYSGMLAAVDGGVASTLFAEPPDPAPPPPPLRTRTRTVGFQVLAGAASTMLDALRAGASGIAPGFAACAPQACYEVFAAWKDSDQPLADEKLARLRAAAHLAAEVFGPGGLKFACDLNGYFGGLPRLPQLPPTGEQRAEIEHLMEGIRN